MRLRFIAIGVAAAGVALSVMAAVVVVQTLRAGETSAIADEARQECAASASPEAREAQTLPAAAPAPISMPSTGTAGLLGQGRPSLALQEACPTASPAPGVNDVAPAPTAAAQATATPLPTQSALPGGSGGDIDAPDIDIPSLPGGGY